MKTFIADIIPKIQKFSKKLDDLTMLTNQHWVSLDEINETKRVFIFRTNNQLLISSNGIVEKGSWEYLGNKSLLLETKQKSILLKQVFFDENIIALKLDSNENYVFFINESKYNNELNNIEDVLNFLKIKYLNKKNYYPNKEIYYDYKIIYEKEKYYFAWGNYIEYKIEFSNGIQGKFYKGCKSGNYFIIDMTIGRKYLENLETTISHLYLISKAQNNS